MPPTWSDPVVTFSTPLPTVNTGSVPERSHLQVSEASLPLPQTRLPVSPAGSKLTVGLPADPSPLVTLTAVPAVITRAVPTTPLALVGTNPAAEVLSWVTFPLSVEEIRWK